MKLTRLSQIGLDKLWILVVLAGIFIFVNTQPIRPHDFWWHIAIGREIINTGVIPSIDIYSFTMPGEAYPSYQAFWLADIILYVLYQRGGPALVIFIQSLMITSAYGLLLWICWRVSNSWRMAALAVLFAATLGINNWNVRPQIISYLLGVIFLVAIYSFRAKPNYRWLAVFPLGMLVWVNSHGSFVIGLALVGIWLGDELWKFGVACFQKKERYSLNGLWAAFLAFGMTLFACLFNPRGVGIVNYLQNLLGNPVVQNLVPEWAAPRPTDVYGLIFLIALLVSAIIIALPSKRPDFFQLVTFLVFGILGMKTMRGVIWFGIVMAPILADHIPIIPISMRKKRIQRKSQTFTHFANLAIIIVLVIGAFISLPWFKNYLAFPRLKAGLISSETPVMATDFLLSEHLPGELFNEIGFGSYLIWAAQLEYKVFVDPRIELYPPEIWWDYTSISNALPGWETKLDQYGVNTVMLNPDIQNNLEDVLGDSPEWKRVFEDLAAIIFVRTD